MITLALIGVGRWGKNYLTAAASLEDIEIKYICAQNKETLDLLPNSYIKTTSVNELFKNDDIDGFIVATPASSHFVLAKQILTINQNLLIEKPLSLNYNHALKLQKIWQVKKPKVLVGHIYLYNPEYKEFKKSFKRLKKIHSIHFSLLKSPPRKDISVIWDWGPHPISVLLDLIEQPVTEVETRGLTNNTNLQLFDSANSLIRFASGIEASINMSWFGPQKIRKLTIKSNDQKIELDYAKPSTIPLKAELLDFTKAIKGLTNIKSDINTGVSVVKILSAMEKSALNKGKSVQIT